MTYCNYNISFLILDLLLIFKWLVCYYLKKTYQRMKELQSNGMSDFDVKNNIQTFLARTLSLVYAEVRRARARARVCVCVCVCIKSYNISIGTEKNDTYYILNNSYISNYGV